jgi:hypothetical protein
VEIGARTTRAPLCAMNERAGSPSCSGPEQEWPIRFVAGATPPAPPVFLEILPGVLIAPSALAVARDAESIGQFLHGPFA